MKVRLLVNPQTIQSVEFSRPEYWSELIVPSPGDFPNPGIKPRSPALQVDSLAAEPPPGKPKFLVNWTRNLKNSQKIKWYIPYFKSFFFFVDHKEPYVEFMMRLFRKMDAHLKYDEKNYENFSLGKPSIYLILEKEMATHSSVLVWRISGMGEPVRLLSLGSHRVGHNWSDLAAAAAVVGWYV